MGFNMLDNLRWFYGRVEDVNDPDQNGRVAVRIYGVHTEDTTLLPTELLPWGKMLMPASNASSAGLGWSPTGITVGSDVMGFALDEAYQNIRIAWVWPAATPTDGSDTNPLALGQVVQSIERQKYNAVENVPVKIEDDPQPEPQPPVDGYDPEKWMTVARGELGVKEYSGKFNNNPRILEYHKTTSLGASEDEVSWCASFVGWVLIQAGYTSTRSALARSYLQWGSPLSEPRYGAVVVFRRGNNPTFGHVAFVQKFDANYVWCIGGNQSDSVKVSRFSRSSVLGYRWPGPATTASAAPAQQNGKWSEPIPDRTPKVQETPPPSGRVQDIDNTGEVSVPSAGGSRYPYNNVMASRSGHIMEVDDTPGGERLHWMHSSGSYKQMLPDGDVVNKSVKDHYDLTMFDKRYYVGRDHNLTIGGTEVQRKTGEVYHLHSSNYSNVVAGTALMKFSQLAEIQAQNVMRIICEMLEVSNTLKVPKILASEIVCDKLSVAQTIEGNIKYAEGAGRAASRAGATPVSTSGPGPIDIKPELEDNGGNFGGKDA
ncbi:baseplate hub subunit and tail lysozyme [Salmonella phage Vi01]|uniref:Gp5-tail associated lysozyme n=8 Tax=Kuttervirus TaxID=2169536 RepID=E1XT85_BPSAV|nr:baseplate hub subunit and tail lysozyme [Salmonella phage Vi01]YP_009021299.1 baseplate hub subunit and tail lysozyme [Salmonella phage vB-SalM-SJ2]AGF88561.1 baseplate hub subunit and tail lysozyme [Salmonella phage FSL SP-063]AGF89080.1 baseplate hub subunit and tail lysozyme [Salmonella phage FSL SP-029]AXF39287.1 tail associated lysozyme [Escherichia phage vB_EcoM_Sa157lw]AYJ73586.1 baseplate hub subunit and tail lysozyme [Salmonella phage PS5]QPX74062.1 putative tail-associated lysozy